MDLPLSQNNIQNVRAKLNRLAGRGILVETEPGSFTQPRPEPERRAVDRPISPNPTGEKGHQLG